MAITEPAGDEQRRRLLPIALGLLAAAGLAWLLFHLARPPQLGADAEAFTSVDALFTAVTARDEKLLGQCEGRLLALKDAGKLPESAWSYLDGVLRSARAGRWQPAAESLYDFMLAQRREGAEEHRPRKQDKGRK